MPPPSTKKRSTPDPIVGLDFNRRSTFYGQAAGAMDRRFLIMVLAASAVMFAGVWILAAPAAPDAAPDAVVADAPAEVAPDASSTIPAPPPAPPPSDPAPLPSPRQSEIPR
jgi:hypothetical protein